MSLSHPAGLLAAYNSLTDKHLAGYFNNTRIRKHLLRSGLITRNGRILSEKEYKLNIMKRDHQKYIRECLAQAIFHKVLDMERYHQLEVKRKLETLARKQQVQRFKGEHKRQSIGNNMPILSPHPPVGPKTNHSHNILVNEGHSSPLTLTAPRPFTAPGNMQPPIRLQPLPRNPAVGTVPKLTLGSRSKTSLLENEPPFPIGGKKAMQKFRSAMEKSQRMNPYQLPNIDNYMAPIPPPPPPPSAKIVRESKSETWRRRRLHPAAAPNDLEPLFTRESGRIYKTSLHSNAAITMIYLGKNVHLSYDDPDFRDEIRVYQQHCGGENLCVYKGKLLEKETFQFISKRHHGFPFSLTFFLNGMQVNRLSSCCEYKYRKGSRLGGKRGYFGFVCVERASPCYKCIIAMGLDRKPHSVKPRNDKSLQDRDDLRRGAREPSKVRALRTKRGAESEGSKLSASASFSVEEIKPEVREMRSAMEEMEREGNPGQGVWEDDQEYEEDFEVDEEKQDEKANEEGHADDQMNGISKSPSEDEKDNLSPEKEHEISAQKAAGAHDNEKDEDEGCSESESEEDKQDSRSASPASSRSHLSSSDSDAESGPQARGAESSTDDGARSSSSPQLSADEEPGKPLAPVEGPLETALEDQRVRRADVETEALPTEEGSGDPREEGRGAGRQSWPMQSGEPAPQEDEAEARGLLRAGRTGALEPPQEGPPAGEGGVGQTISGTLATSCQSHCHAESGAGSADDGGTPVKKPGTDLSGAPNRNLVVEERVELNTNKEPKEITQEMHAPVKEATKASEGLQHRDADLTEEDKADAAQLEKAGANEFPSGEWKPVLAEQLTEKSEISVGLASGAQAEEEEDGRLRPGELDLPGTAAARDPVSLNGEQVHKEQALRQTEKPASPTVEQGSVSTELPHSAAPGSQSLGEVLTLREAATPETEEAESQVAGREGGFKRLDGDGREEEEPTGLEPLGAVEDTQSLKEDGPREATLGEQEQDKEGLEAPEAEIPSSSSTVEAKAETRHLGTASGSCEDLPQEATMREETVTEPRSNLKGDREETLPEQLDVARERRKPERTPTSLRETGSEKKVVTWADALTDEDKLEEEQKLKEEEAKTTEEIRCEEQARAPRKETESVAEEVEPTEATNLPEDTELLEDSPEERLVNWLEATPEFEKSPEKVTVLRKEEGGEEPSETRDTEHRGWAEQRGQVTMALSNQGEGHEYGEQGIAEGPGCESLGERKAPDLTIPDKEQAAECVALDQDNPDGPGLEERDEESPPQRPEGVRAMTVTPEDVPEGDPRMAEKFNEEAENEDSEEQGDQKSMLETGMLEDSTTEQDGAVGRGTVMAEEGLEERGAAGTAAERKEVLADLTAVEGKTLANTAVSPSDAAGEEVWLQGDKALGKAAAGERVVAEERALSRSEGTVASAAEADAKEPSKGAGAALKVGQGGEGDAEAAEVGSRGGDPGPAGRVAEERESELSRGSLELAAVLPVKSDFSGTREKQEHMVQRQSESAEIP